MSDQDDTRPNVNFGNIGQIPAEPVFLVSANGMPSLWDADPSGDVRPKVSFGRLGKFPASPVFLVDENGELLDINDIGGGGGSGDFVTEDQLNQAISSFITSDDLNNAIQGFATSQDISDAISTLSGEIATTYLTVSDFSDWTDNFIQSSFNPLSDSVNVLFQNFTIINQTISVIQQDIQDIQDQLNNGNGGGGDGGQFEKMTPDLILDLMNGVFISTVKTNLKIQPVKYVFLFSSLDPVDVSSLNQDGEWSGFDDLVYKISLSTFGSSINFYNGVYNWSHQLDQFGAHPPSQDLVDLISGNNAFSYSSIRPPFELRDYNGYTTFFMNEDAFVNEEMKDDLFSRPRLGYRILLNISGQIPSFPNTDDFAVISAFVSNSLSYNARLNLKPESFNNINGQLVLEGRLNTYNTYQEFIDENITDIPELFITFEKRHVGSYLFNVNISVQSIELFATYGY